MEFTHGVGISSSKESLLNVPSINFLIPASLTFVLESIGYENFI